MARSFNEGWVSTAFEPLRWVALLLVVSAIGVAACSGGTTTASAPSQIAPHASTPDTTSTQPADDVAGATLCTAVRALQEAQNDHASPMAALMVDWMTNLGSEPAASERAEALVHGQAIADVVTTYGATLSGLRSPQHGDLIVDARDAYAGYALGITTLRPAFDAAIDADFSSIALEGFDQMRAGKSALEAAIDALDRLDARGVLICPS